MTDIPIAIVLIGRNEGERLRNCLTSIPDAVPAVYVDSGSTDNSVEAARARGVLTVDLDVSGGFTAAKARNAGWRALEDAGIAARYVQFIDGDCQLREGWLEAAYQALEQEPDLAAVFGRRRERFPLASPYNQMCDDEWNVPVGLVASCGGDAMFRMEALRPAGGYCDDLIAGEEPDLCLRLGRQGWRIRRIDQEMTWHDAAITTFRGWWLRARRSGFAYAEHVRRHGRQSNPGWLRQLASIIAWSCVLPAILLAFALLLYALGCSALYAVALAAGIYLGQIFRMALQKRKQGSRPKFALQYAAMIVLGKFAECGGVFRCYLTRILQRRAKIIEYKGAA